MWRTWRDSGVLVPRGSYHPKHQRARMYEYLPYTEYWRYGTYTCKEESAKDRFNSIMVVNQLKFDFAKAEVNAANDLAV